MKRKPSFWAGQSHRLPLETIACTSRQRVTRKLCKVNASHDLTRSNESQLYDFGGVSAAMVRSTELQTTVFPFKLRVGVPYTASPCHDVCRQPSHDFQHYRPIYKRATPPSRIEKLKRTAEKSIPSLPSRPTFLDHDEVLRNLHNRSLFCSRAGGSL